MNSPLQLPFPSALVPTAVPAGWDGFLRPPGRKGEYKYIPIYYITLTSLQRLDSAIQKNLFLLMEEYWASPG